MIREFEEEAFSYLARVSKEFLWQCWFGFTTVWYEDVHHDSKQAILLSGKFLSEIGRGIKKQTFEQYRAAQRKQLQQAVRARHVILS